MKPPKTLWSRSSELLSLAAKLGAQELKKRTSGLGDDHVLRKVQVQVEQAQALTESLGRLKGVAMKFGQTLSVEARDFLPPEVIEVLTKLQDQAPGLSEAESAKRLRECLGAERFARLEELELKPIAAASIGQVHRARLEGQPVALKLRYPGLSETVDSDLKLLKSVLTPLLKISGKNVDLDPLLAEVGEVFRGELDYAQEAANLEKLRAAFAPYPDYVFPRVHREFSTESILTLSYESGLRHGEWLATHPSAEERRHFGKLLLDLYAIEFFEAGIVQTDPNFANFLFRPESGQLVLLDFGAVKTYAAEFRRDYRRLLAAARSEDLNLICEQALSMKLIDPRETPETQRLFAEMVRISTEPFDPARQPFRFTDLDYITRTREAALRFTRHAKYSPPPQALIFLHRKLGGIFNLLRSFDVSIDLTAYWQRLVPET